MKSDITAIYPLSPMQEGMLYHKLLNEESTEYCVRYMLELNGKIEMDMMETALELLCEKYAILKTAIVYPKKSDKPYQVIINDRKIEFTVINLSDEMEKLEDYKKSDIDRGFNLTKDSLLRVTLINNCINKGILLWTFHHIIMDGWCSTFVLKDFFRFYALLLDGKTKAELSNAIFEENKNVATYEDYIHWITEKDKDCALAYWKEYLNGYQNSTVIAPLLAPEYCMEEMKRTSSLLDDITTEKVLDLSRKLNVTVSTILETALGILLQKFNQSNDIVFGKVVSGRNADFKDIDKIVGLFINTVPVRMNFNENIIVRDVLLKMQEESINAMEYEYCPLVEIQNNSNENNDLINVLFVYENYYREDINESIAQYSKAIDFKLLEGREQTNYNINFSISMQDVLKIDILYNPNYFNKQDIEMIMEKYCLILKEIMNFEQPLSKIYGIPEKERQIINTNKKGMSVSIEDYDTIGSSLLDIVKKYPKKIALAYNDIEISYEELDNKSNLIANKLLKSGVRRHSNVMIYANKSIDTIIAICGIIKAGAVYVPVDPNYPKDRMEFIYHDCKAAVVLTTETSNKFFSNSLNISEILAEENEVLESTDVGCKTELAYIIYTSGTTGEPKGVMVTHENVLRLTRNVTYTHLNCKTNLIQTGSLSFDATTFEIWGVLLNGGKVVITPSDLILDMIDLKNTIEQNKVNTMFVTTALFNQIIDIDLTVFDNIKYLLFGGEATSKVHVDKLLNYNKKVNLCNVYGPTETTTFASFYPIKEITRDKKIPIGKPIEGTSVYVLNGETECGIGIPGELCIGGSGVAQGYLNNDNLTKKKFIYYQNAKEIIYRSGDLVRWLPSGNLDFLGRIDEQIKLRGYRIELSEIENVMRKNENIKDVAVVANTINEEICICAYVVGLNDEEIEHIKSDMKNSLPSYMIPSYIISVEKLPLNQNGKLERKALPKIINTEMHTNESMDDITEKLFYLYSEITGAKNFNIKDSFFEIGGHSLKAMKLANKIETTFKLRIPLKIIYKYPSIEGLGNYIKQKNHKQSERIYKADNSETYPLSSVQEEIYAASSLDDIGVAYNMYLGLVSKNKININRVRTVYKTLLQRHEILRYGFFEGNNCIVQKVFKLNQIDSDIEVQYKKIENEDAEIEELKKFVKPFDLQKPPLFKVKVIITPDSKDLIFFNIHHIVADGISTEILQKEFTRLYFGKALDDAELCYKDFCVWSKKHDWRNAKKFWKKEIETSMGYVNFPFDFVRASVRSFRGKTLSKTISSTLIDAIGGYCQRTHITEYIFFISIFFSLLHQYSRQDDLVVGTPFSGRSKEEIQNTVGMFVNTLPVSCRISKEMLFTDLITQVKEKCIAIQEYQDSPFNEFAKSYKASHANKMLFNILMNYIDFGAASMKKDEFAERAISINNNIAKFDMSLTINRSEENCDIQLEYSEDLLMESTVIRILDHYIMLINEVVTNDKVLINKLPLLLESEQQTILHKFNFSNQKLDCSDTVISLFKKNVADNGEKIAIVAKGKKLTYIELDRASNALANELRRRGIKKNDLIAIAAEHRIEVIVGILGIIKVGAAYVPIDKSYPEMRNKQILSDCDPVLILQFNNNTCFDIPYLDITDCHKDLIRKTYIDDNAEQSDLAYIIYTSGTTGGAKGVMVTNRNIVRLVKRPNYICLNQNTKLLQTGSLCFDAATFEIWGTLVHGGTLYFEDTDLLFDLHWLQQYISDKKINTMWLTVSLFNQIVDENVVVLDGLKYLMIGGEKLSEKHVKKFLQNNKITELINGYGPTETTTFATYYPLNKWDQKKNIPIGKPINNTKVYVMSGEGNLCGVGLPGELCIGGDGVSNGYINNLELTNSKFINNPFGEGKIYKTGDLTKWREDGVLDFLGRIDSQVKMRGYRIELKEIENELKNIPKVLNAIVTLTDDRLHLCAYIVNDGKLDIGFVREELKRRLPYYMVPTYIQEIKEIPLTPNGKVDQKLLPPIVKKGSNEEIVFSDKEKIVSNIFKEILNIEKIGKHDNFYELGGDSITAIKLVSKLKLEGYTISMREIIQKQTIYEIAKSMRDISDTSLLEHSHDHETKNLSPMQLEFFRWNLPVPDYFNQAIMLKTKERLDAVIVRNILEAIVQCHSIFHTAITKDGQTIEMYKPGKFFELNTFDFTQLKDYKNAIESLSTELQKSMKLSKGKLLKVNFYKTPDCDYIFFCMHHIVCDIVSWAILLEDFERGYFQAKNNGKVDLQVETYSYLSWTERILECSNSSLSVANSEFWRGKIADGNRSYKQKEGEYYKTIYQEYYYKDLGLAIKKASAYGFDMQEILLIAFSEAWNKYSGLNDLIINVENHGRDIQEDVDVNRTIGWFTCIYPLNIKFNAASTIYERLNNIKLELAESKKRLASYMYYMMNEEHGSTVRNIMFNYSGNGNEKLNSKLFEKTTYSSGETMDMRNIISDYIINCGLKGDTLSVDLWVTSNIYQRHNVNILLDAFTSSIETIIEYLKSDNVKLPNKEKDDSQHFNHIAIETKNVFHLSRKQIAPKEVEPVVNKLLQYDMNANTSINTTCVPFLYQKYFLEQYPDNICCAKVLVEGEVNEETVLEYIYNIVKSQTIFRMGYNKQTSLFEVYEFNNDWFIPVSECSDSIPEIAFEYAHKMHEKLLSKIVVAKETFGWSIFYFVHHCLWDLSSTEILNEITKNTILGKEDSRKDRYLKYILKRNEKENRLINSNENKLSSQNYLYEVKSYCESMNNIIHNNMVEIKYRIVPRLLDDIINNPLAWGMKLFDVLNPVELKSNKIPFIMMQQGRISEEYSTLGLFLDIKPYVYNSMSDDICRDYNQNNIGPLLMQLRLNPHYKNILNLIPVINFYIDTDENELFSTYERYEINVRNGIGNSEITIRVFQNTLYATVPTSLDDYDVIKQKILGLLDS